MHVHLLLYVRIWHGIFQHQIHIQSNYTLTLSCVAACSESESSKEAGGRRRDGAGEDRWTEEKGSERHGGTDGAQRGLADQSHSTGNWAQVSISFSLSPLSFNPICCSPCEILVTIMQDTSWQSDYHSSTCEWVTERDTISSFWCHWMNRTACKLRHYQWTQILWLLRTLTDTW